MKRVFTAFTLLALTVAGFATAAPAKPAAKADSAKPDASTFSGLSFRSIGPAVVSGRVLDIAVSPRDKSTWFVVTAYGGVFKTSNAGTTFSPVLDNAGTPSFGCVTIDAKNPLNVWVGSGENNSQRSVGWGDGVYKSTDGGKTFTNVGLKASEHIGQIAVDPRNSNVVFVAAQGPLWAPGGDRGLYKSTDGGKTWKRTLNVDEWTGANEVRFDPRDPDVLYCTTYQRHRKTWTLIDGGPGSAIYKSTDGGETWNKLTNGLPTEDMGRIGLTISPAAPEVVYAIVEAANGAGGLFRSSDAGANWEKMNGYGTTSGQYYNEIFADPKQPGRVYLEDTYLQITEDGGRTIRPLGEKSKHVDNHIVWIDPDDTRHLLVGCDGGLYESFDRGGNWIWMSHLPITQFYKVDVDNSLPFYYVYGGTQDNNSLGGPSQTLTQNGALNSDWFVTTGGDGFTSKIDPEDPNTVYAESQHAGVVRYDRKSGEQVDIQPQPAPGESGSRWNWDTPIVISPYDHKRIYMASQRVYRSEDRGDTWTPISGDLTRQIERNKLKVMGRVWGVDAVAKNASTSFYGNIVSLAESPVKKDLLWVGCDDGLIQVSDDGGGHWRRIDSVPGVPEYAYVSRLIPSQYDANTVYATFERHKMGDFKPYVFKSTDLGKTWVNIAADLPANATVWCLAEDFIDRDLLFVGTEFGLFFTQDAGKRWLPFKSGLPMQTIKDMVIQKREGDLVLATFGRGFYILDDYSPLRLMKSAQLNDAAALLPVKQALLYVPKTPLSGRGKAQAGERLYTAENPPFGASITYYLKDDSKTAKDARHEREKEIAKKGGDTFYPSWDSLRAEAREEAASVVLTVTDDQSQVVRRITGPASSGFHRVAWDLRYASTSPTTLEERDRGEFDGGADAPLVTPGTYQVSMARVIDGVATAMASPQKIVVAPLENTNLPVGDRATTLAFQKRTAALGRALEGATSLLGEAQGHLKVLRKALLDTPNDVADLQRDAKALSIRFADLNLAFYGDNTLRSHNEPTPPSLVERVNVAANGWTATTPPTTTHKRNVEIASSEFEKALATLKAAVADLRALEAKAEAAGAPWTSGRVPEWKAE